MTDRLPPLPEDDEALETLMSKHLDPVEPSHSTRERTLVALREASAGAAPAPTRGDTPLSLPPAATERAPRGRRAGERPGALVLGAVAAGLLGAAALSLNYAIHSDSGPTPIGPVGVPTPPRVQPVALPPSPAAGVFAGLDKASSFEERIAVCDRALNLDPTYAPALLARARLCFVRARDVVLVERARNSLLESARRDLRAAFAQDPDLIDGHALNYELCMFENDERAAIGALGRIEELDGEGALGSLARGLEEEMSRRYGDALTHFDRAIELDSKLGAAYLARARVHLRDRTFSKAIASAATAVELDPGSAEALVALGRARYFASGRSDRGILKLMDRALELAPASSAALALRAYARLERDSRGRVVSSPAECARAVEDAQWANEVRGEALAFLALSEVAVWHEGDRAKAEKHAEQAIGLDGRDHESFLLRARIRLLGNQLEEADRDLERVLTLTESRPETEQVAAEALTQRARIRVANRDYTAAKGLLQRALELDDRNAVAWFLLGKVLHHDPKRQAGDWRTAEQHYSKAISLDGSVASAWFHRGALRIDRSRGVQPVKEWEEALADLEKAEALQKADPLGVWFAPYYIDLLRGYAHHGLQEWDRAKRHLEAFVKEASPGEENYARAKTLLREIEAKLEADPGAWTFKPGQAPDFEADMDYGQLRLLLKANTIAIGKVARVDAQGAGVLEGVEVIRGEAPQKAPTVGEFNGCEGVPDFRGLVGQRVCVFLVRKNNELQLLHGSEGIQRLPYRGKLDAAALTALVKTGELEAKQLEALVTAHGVSVLDWLEGQLPGSAEGALDSAGVQDALRGLLSGLTASTGRGDVMAVARYLRAKTLDPQERSALWAYHETFTSNPLGAYVQGKPGYSNRVEDHIAFLRFMSRYDTRQALIEAERGLDRTRRLAADRRCPPAWIDLYSGLVEELQRKWAEQERR